MSPLPTAHLDKLQSAIENEKTPSADRDRLEAAKANYLAWIAAMTAVSGTPEQCLTALVGHYNAYRTFVDVELIFDSPHDFLYRQKGQLKLDNSVLEEFLPWLVTPKVVPELAGYDLAAGPRGCFSAAYFSSSLATPLAGGGLTLRSKDQDFALAMPIYLKASHKADFSQSETKATFLAYVAAECKTNLDKTMFQEACSTARDVKGAVTGAKYFVICEWLDMTPVSTAATDIDEVLILRGKRLGSNVRKDFDTVAKRGALRDKYSKFLSDSPARPEVFARFVAQIRKIFNNELPEESDVLGRGYF
jgi:hypothetical protein